MAIVPTPEGGWMTRPIRLDFGAIMLTGAGAGVDLALLSALLPDVETAVLHPDNQVEEEADDDDP